MVIRITEYRIITIDKMLQNKTDHHQHITTATTILHYQPIGSLPPCTRCHAPLPCTWVR
jgi:hypothetical protein